MGAFGPVQENMQGLEMATTRKKSVATCSTCKAKLQEIVETGGGDDDLYLMSISLLPGVIKLGRSKCPTQRALQLQESSPFWVFPQVVWVDRGYDEKRVHSALRAYRIEDAPSREYFRLPIKSGVDLVEQILYADTCDESRSAQENTGMQEQDSGSASKKRKVVMCAPCKKLQYTVSDVQTHGDAQHLFIVTAAFCKDMVGIIRASDVHQRIAELEKELPSKLQPVTIYYGQGHRVDDIYQGMKSFRADCPGDWYYMDAKAASRAISVMLFGDNDDASCEPGIILEDATD